MYEQKMDSTFSEELEAMEALEAYALGAAVALALREVAGWLFCRTTRGEEATLRSSTCRPPGRRRLLG